MLIVGPNLTIDRMIGLDRFDAGNIHRAHRVDARIGGGGVNAARVARRLGARARLISLLPRADAATVSDALAAQGITVEWVHCEGSVRIATILREEVGRMSVLNEPGPAVAPQEWEAFTKLVERRLSYDELLVCSGSLPPGAPEGGYAWLARQARHAGSPCVIDVAGGALAAALDDGEGLVVPNLAEAEALLYGPRSESVQSDDDAAERAQDAANSLLRRGAWKVVVTAGRAGAAYAELGPRGRRGWIASPEVEAQNPIGAGDAFASGLGLRLEEGAPLDAAVAYATAVAAAHVESPGGEISRERVDALAEPPLAGTAAGA